MRAPSMLPPGLIIHRTRRWTLDQPGSNLMPACMLGSHGSQPTGYWNRPSSDSGPLLARSSRRIDLSLRPRRILSVLATQLRIPGIPPGPLLRLGRGTILGHALTRTLQRVRRAQAAPCSRSWPCIWRRFYRTRRSAQPYCSWINNERSAVAGHSAAASAPGASMGRTPESAGHTADAVGCRLRAA